MAKMTENSRKTLEYLKAQGVGTGFTYKEVAEALGFEKCAAVIGAVGGFYKKGLVEKFEEEVEIDGKVKTVKKFALTEAGADFNPDAQAED